MATSKTNALGITAMVLIAFVSSASIACPNTDCVAAFTTDLGNSFNRTHQTPYVVQYLGESKPLRAFDDNIDDSGYVYGRYRNILDDTSGHDLLIFPDGQFAMTEWCDICGEPQTLYVGKWQKTANTLSFEVTAQDNHENSRVQIEYGDKLVGSKSKMEFFVVADKNPFANLVLVTDPMQAHVPYDGFLVRTQPIGDWQEEQSKVLADLAQGADGSRRHEPLLSRAIQLINSLSLGSGALWVALVCGALGLGWGLIPQTGIRWFAVLVFPLALAYSLYWIPVWGGGADPAEFGSWELIIIVPWYVAGAAASAVGMQLVHRYRKGLGRRPFSARSRHRDS